MFAFKDIIYRSKKEDEMWKNIINAFNEDQDNSNEYINVLLKNLELMLERSFKRRRRFEG